MKYLLMRNDHKFYLGFHRITSSLWNFKIALRSPLFLFFFFIGEKRAIYRIWRKNKYVAQETVLLTARFILQFCFFCVRFSTLLSSSAILHLLAYTRVRVFSWYASDAHPFIPSFSYSDLLDLCVCMCMYVCIRVSFSIRLFRLFLSIIAFCHIGKISIPHFLKRNRRRKLLNAIYMPIYHRSILK